MDAKILGNYIAARRKELGMTQANLAEKIHVTDKAVSRWERGVGLPDIDNLEAIAVPHNRLPHAGTGSLPVLYTEPDADFYVYNPCGVSWSLRYTLGRYTSGFAVCFPLRTPARSWSRSQSSVFAVGTAHK